MPDYGTESGLGTGDTDKSYTTGSGYITTGGGDKGGGGQDNNPNAGDSGAKKSLEDQLEAMRKAYEDQLVADAEEARLRLERLQEEEAMRLQEESFDQPDAGETSSKSAFEKIIDDFLMDIGAKAPDADYYDRLGEREERSRTALEQSQEDRRSGNNNTQDDLQDDLQDDVAEDDFSNIPIFVRDPYAGGIGAFGYSPELMQFESQQGAGQVPYYMAAARNAQNPNISPAFQYAAENYDILGGEQRTAPRPIEMMSAAERAQILGIDSNFNTPNYNSPYYGSSEQNEFDYYKNMFGGGGSPGKGGGGVGPGLVAGLDYPISPDIIEKYKYIISDLFGGNMQSDTTTTPTDTSTTTSSSSAQAYDLLQDAMNAGTEQEKNALLDQVGSTLEAGVREAGGDIVRPEPPNVLPPNASFKFKYGTPSVDNFGRRQYTGTMLVEMPDGTISTYRAGTHSSRQKLQDDFNRMMAGVNASLRGQVQTVNQNYGTQSVDVSPTDVTMSGGTLSGPGTFTVRDRSTGQNQIVDDRGIRQGNPFYGSVNRNDPNYDVMLDAIVNPVTGSPMGMMSAAPQQRSQFNSMGELMDFQSQNPTMNLMGEYQRLSELE